MVIVMAGKKTFHSAQGDKLHPLRTDDIIVLAQTDSSALEGYRTVSSSLADAAKGVTNQIKVEGGAGIIVTDPTQGIIGDGRATTPIEVDSEYFNKNWVVNQYVNVTQVGNQTLQILPMVKGDGYNITVGSNISVYLGGLNLTFPAQTINIKDHVSSPDSQTLYMYFILVDSVLRILITRTARAERYDSTYIGTIQMGVGVINTINTKPFMRVGNYRLSETVQGSAIPVTGNSPWVAEYPSWGGQGTLTPVRAGIDPSKYTGNTTFNLETETVRVFQDGQFFIQDLALALSNIGRYQQVFVSGGVDGAMGYLNGINIWKGKGSSSNVYDRSSLLREGWNVVHMEWGELQIRGPFLK